MKNLKKYRMASLSFVLVVLMLVCFAGTAAISAESGAAKNKETTSGEVSSKEEVVYARLALDGSVNEIYTVNVLNVIKAGNINDYGSYSLLKNLTSTEVLTYDGNQISVNAPVGRFYYQGNQQAAVLPWDFSLQYYLDDIQTDASSLIGKSGRLELQINTTPNQSVDPSFYEKYLLQISVTLDADKCTNLVADGATLANSGSDKLITFTVMPATQGELCVSADVIDFSMKGLQFSAVPFAMNIELPETTELTGQLVQLSDAISQLSGGVADLEAGLSKLKEGTKSLASGSSEYNNGIHELSDQSKTLEEASRSLRDGLSLLSSSLEEAGDTSDLTALVQLPSALTAISSGLDQLSTGLSALSTGFGSAYTALDSAILSIPQEEIAAGTLQQLIADHPKDIAIGQLVEHYTAARTILATYQMVAPAFEAVNTQLPLIQDSTTKIAGSLDTIATELSTSMEGFDLSASLTQLSTGISALNLNYNRFHQGLLDYTDGVASLASSYSELNAGIASVANGSNQIFSGAGELKDGAAKLNENTKNMPQQIDSTMEDLLASYKVDDISPVSFTSKENENVTSVQFVMQTDPIEKEDIPEVIANASGKETFLSRLLDLFR